MPDRFQRFTAFALFVFAILVPMQIGRLQISGASADLKAALGSTAASWAQAIGTVAAFMIAFAIAIGENDRERARRTEAAREHRLRTRGLARQLATMVDERMQAAKMAFDGDPLKVEAAGWALTQRTVEADLAVIRALNPHDLEEVKPMQTYALLVGLMRSACDILEPLAQGALDRKSSFKIYVSKAKAGIAELQKEVGVLARLLDTELTEIEKRESKVEPPPRSFSILGQREPKTKRSASSSALQSH